MAALFKDVRSFVIGAVVSVVAIAATAWKDNSFPLWLCALAFCAVIFGRLCVIEIFNSKPRMPLPLKEAEKWEAIYSIGGGLHSAVLGLWCFLCFVDTTDTFSQLLSAVVTIGCTAAIPGRNFGRVGVASVQIAGLCLPLILGWLLQFDGYYLFLAFITLPFFAALLIMCLRLQGTLLDALMANNKLGVLGQRFDVALCNMPHGLCMLNRNSEVEVYNARFVEILGLNPGTALQQRKLGEVLRDCAPEGDAGLVSALHAGQLDDLLRSRARVSRDFDMVDGRTLTLTLQPIASGGAVLIAEDITERRRAEARIAQLARFDPVTEIANRAYFREQMDTLWARARRSGTRCALYFIDLDHFKAVNDTLGHACGDVLLRTVSARLTGIMGPGDLLGRFGGDEFLIFQAAVQDDAAIEALASRITREMARPFSILNNTLRIGASVGVAVAREEDADPDFMMQHADLALYRAKASGRGAWCIYEPAMDLAALRRRNLERDLRAALAADSFELYYQPLVSLHDGRIETCEALLRWHHPERGMVPPIEFIPLAEELGLIVDLGARVLDMACTVCRTWPEHTRVAVNLSSAQFQAGDLAEIIHNALSSSGLAPERLEVEITESLLLQDTARIQDALQKIRDLGVSVVLDDFGTGYSSLSYLHNFPIQKVKLDRSFLSDITESARSLVLLDGIGKLSRMLGLKVVVEGVETEVQLDLVRGLGSVDQVQGYLLGRPMPAAKIRDTLEASVGTSLLVSPAPSTMPPAEPWKVAPEFTAKQEREPQTVA